MSEFESRWSSVSPVKDEMLVGMEPVRPVDERSLYKGVRKRRQKGQSRRNTHSNFIEDWSDELSDNADNGLLNVWLLTIKFSKLELVKLEGKLDPI